jgi:glutathione synthase/RimK-type ligase-like ATP-grasp enzyme
MIYRALHVIELNLGIPVFPNHGSSWHRRDKLSQYYLLQTAGAPMPKTWVFWDKEKARHWALQTIYPKVFKLSGGGGGKDVVLVSTSEEACRLIDLMFGTGLPIGRMTRHLNGSIPKNWQQLRLLASRCKAGARYAVEGQPPTLPHLEKGYVYFQEFIPGIDDRAGIIVIGHRAFGSLGPNRFNRPNDFRSHSEHYDPSKIDLRCVQTAFDISERLGFHFMAYEFLLHPDGPLLLEMNFRNGRTRGYWNRNLEWVSEAISPQEAQVEVFLKEICSRKQALTMEELNLRTA